MFTKQYFAYFISWHISVTNGSEKASQYWLDAKWCFLKITADVFFTIIGYLIGTDWYKINRRGMLEKFIEFRKEESV